MMRLLVLSALAEWSTYVPTTHASVTDNVAWHTNTALRSEEFGNPVWGGFGDVEENSRKTLFGELADVVPTYVWQDIDISEAGIHDATVWVEGPATLLWGACERVTTGEGWQRIGCEAHQHRGVARLLIAAGDRVCRNPVVSGDGAGRWGAQVEWLACVSTDPSECR